MDPNVAKGLVRSAGAKPPPVQQPSGFTGLVRRHEETAAKAAASLNTAERRSLAKKGNALPDGSFPIRNAQDLQKAIIRAHQATDPERAKAFVKKRAREMGMTKMIPEDWAAAAQPIRQVGTSIRSLEEAIAVEPEPEDKQRLEKALSELKAVQRKNVKEQRGQTDNSGGA